MTKHINNIPQGQAFFSERPINLLAEYQGGMIILLFHRKLSFAGCIHAKTNDTTIGVKIKKVLKKFKNLHASPSDLYALLFYQHFSDLKIIDTIFKSYGIRLMKKTTPGSQGVVSLDFQKKDIIFKEKTDLPIQNKKIEEESKDINVLIVDDSKTMRKILMEMLASSPRIKHIDEASDAEDAQKILLSNPPDVITLDINMPGMDGVTFLKKYMKTTPIPTIMVTSFNVNDSGHIMDALENGAFDYVEKPSFNEMMSRKEELLNKIYSAFSAKNKFKKIKTPPSKRIIINTKKHDLDKYLFLLGASTGGTEALKTVLTQFPAEIPPILIVQHIPPVFSKAFADRMNELCPFTVKEAADNDLVLPNQVLIAPGGRHMKITKKSGKYQVNLSDDPPVNRFRPSVDYLFNSVSSTVTQKVIIAGLLTGMGHDGAQGLLALKNSGAYTITQDEDSSVVFGMPKAAIEINAHNEIVPLDKIADIFIKKMINGHNETNNRNKLSSIRKIS